MKTTTSLRSLLALSAATALLLTGCGDKSDDTDGAAGPAGGQRPGVVQVDDAKPSASTAAPATADSADVPAAADQPTEAAHSPADDEDALTDFPLAAGWPDEAMEPQYGGLTLPVDTLFSRFDQQTCGTSAPDPTVTASLRGEFKDVEAYLSRELLVFDDADAAVAYVSELDDFYATDACTTASADGADDSEGGEATYPLRRVGTEYGGESFAVVRGTEYEGEAQVGMSALHVVRVGRSVLLDTTWGEGLIRDAQDARELADSMGERAGDAIAAQCAFTVAGC